MTEKNRIRFLPDAKELDELFQDHEAYCDRVLPEHTDRLIEKVKTFKETRLFGMGNESEKMSKNMPPEPFIPNEMWMADSQIDEFAEKKVLLTSYYENMVVVKEKLSICPVSFYYPPFHHGTPIKLQTTPTADWYPTSSAQAFPQNGRLEVGTLTDQEHAQKKVGNLGISEANASLGIVHMINSVKGPSLVTVKTRACVDGAFQGFAYQNGNVINTILNLYLTVTAANQQVTPVGVCVFNKSVQGIPNQTNIIYEKMDAVSFFLTSQFEINAPTYLIATVRANAISMGQQFKKPEGHWNEFSIVDVEGHAKPNGTYYPKAGSIFVSGFSVTICPK